MPTPVPVNERILRQIRTDVAAISGIGTVVRFSSTGRWWTGTEWLNGLQHLDAMVVFSGEQEIQQSLGNSAALVTMRMTVGVGVVIAPSEEVTTSTDSTLRDWISRVKTKVMTNHQITESGGTRLAIETRVSNVPDVTTTEGQRETNALTFFEVDYMHPRNNPTVGPGITVFEE